MHPRSVIIDLSIDQGGCVETSRPTTHADPVFIEENVIHYCVPNIPSVVARTATHAFLNGAWTYGEIIARDGLEAALATSTELQRGVVIRDGHIIDPICGLPGLPRLHNEFFYLVLGGFGHLSLAWFRLAMALIMWVRS
jgi:alanine dehydrogenase